MRKSVLLVGGVEAGATKVVTLGYRLFGVGIEVVTGYRRIKGTISKARNSKVLNGFMVTRTKVTQRGAKVDNQHTEDFVPPHPDTTHLAKRLTMRLGNAFAITWDSIG